jgi:hypothetical protein
MSCLFCDATIAIAKSYNMNQHYEIHRQHKYAKLEGEEQKCLLVFKSDIVAPSTTQRHSGRAVVETVYVMVVRCRLRKEAGKNKLLAMEMDYLTCKTVKNGHNTK